MARLTWTLVLTLVPLALAGCNDSSQPTEPHASAPSAAAAGRGLSTRFVSMMDACDPATFNAVLGPGSCTRQGGVSFDEFVAQLQRHQEVGAWHFAPPTLQAKASGDQVIIATNRGGEEHTFTRVANFGGGIVPMLNDLSGNPTVAPECNQLDEDDFVEPGGTYTATIDASGTLLFQCCIHPWMRTVVHATHK